MGKKKDIPRAGCRLRAKEWLTFAAIVLCGGVVPAYFFQPPVSLQQGLGWDGVVYYEMVVQAFNGEEIAQRAPFVYRHSLPRLVALLIDTPTPSAVIGAFKVINVSAAILASCFILFLLRFYITDWRVRVGVAVLYPLHTLGYLRFTFLSSVTTDSVALLCLAGALVGMHYLRTRPEQEWRWSLLLAAAFLLAVLMRPSHTLLWSLAVPFCVAPGNTGSWWERHVIIRLLYCRRLVFFLPFLVALAGYLWTRHDINVTGYYGQGQQESMLSFYLAAIVRNMHIKKLLYATFLSFGPALIIVLWQWRAIYDLLQRHWHWLFLLVFQVSFGILVGDMQRMMIYAFPIYALLLAWAVQQRWEALSVKPLLITILLVAQLISQRVFWALPSHVPFAHPDMTPADYPLQLPLLFTPFSSDILIYDLVIVNYTREPLINTALTQYVLFSIIMMIYLLFCVKQRKQK